MTPALKFPVPLVDDIRSPLKVKLPAIVGLFSIFAPVIASSATFAVETASSAISAVAILPSNYQFL